MNKQAAKRLLLQHFSQEDVSSWLTEWAAIDTIALQIYKELVAKATNKPDDIFDATTGITHGRYLSTTAYKWAIEMILAKMRFDNRPRTDLKNLQDSKACLAKLVELKVIKTDIEEGVATEEQKRIYAETKESLWLEARRLTDG